MAVGKIGLNIRANFGDSRSNRSSDIRPAHFVMDDERATTTDRGQDDIKEKRHSVSPTVII